MDGDIESIYEDAKKAGYELNLKTSEETDWESLRLDNEEGYEIEEMLECVGIEIPLPDVPEPKSVDVSEE